MSIVSPKSSFRRVHVRALTASGSLKFRLKGTSSGYGRQRPLARHTPGADTHTSARAAAGAAAQPPEAAWPTPPALTTRPRPAPPTAAARALPHPAGEGGLHVLLELGVLGGQVGEVGRFVLVAVARVHGLVEGHGGR